VKKSPGTPVEVSTIPPTSGAALEPEVEKELIRKCRAGDPRFYEPLVRAYEGPGMRLATGMMGNLDDARDALQEAFVKVFHNLGRFDLQRPFGPWFYQILRNQCRDMLRTRQARFRLETVDERLELRPADAERGPERVRERSAAKELLWRGLERVGAEHREVLVLKELQGLRYHEIAEILDIPEGTVASRLFHARRALKQSLEELGIRYP
jgi:RNA polymerase sigma-70 factor, ECF subfamily